MYKVIIVDDESIIRRGLSQNIDWNKYGFEIAAAVSNGQEGLNKILEIKPDIVITDVKMPVMNGLEMIEKLKELHVQCRILVMTGFEDFEYARKSINLNVDKFLTKPINNDELTAAMKEICDKIKEQCKLMKQVEESFPIMQQAFLLKLLDGKASGRKAIEEEIEYFNLPINNGDFAAAIIKADDYYNTEYYDAVMDKELCKFGIYNIAEELVSNKFATASYLTNCDDIVLIINKQNSNVYDYNLLTETLKEVCRNVSRCLKTTVTIAVGGFYSDYSGIHSSYAEALTAIEYRHVFGKNIVISINDINKLDRGQNIDISEFEKSILSNLKLGFKDGANLALNKIKEIAINNSAYTLEKTRLIAMELALLIIKESASWVTAADEILSCNLHDSSKKIFKLLTVDDIFSLLSQMINEIADAINNSRSTQQQEIIEQVVDFIEHNYQDETLSLQAIANNVHISQSYLSTMFKKEKNKNFIDYLTEVRMEKAKELLRKTSKKAYEVAGMVGYSNPQYFSLCFKKYTGFSPLQFKNV